MSLRTTVKVSPERLPVSDMLMPPIAVGLPAAVETLAGAVTTGGPFTAVSAMSNWRPPCRRAWPVCIEHDGARTQASRRCQ